MYRLLAKALLVCLLLSIPAASSQSFLGVQPAVPFPEGLDWINTDEPLTLEMLEGKIVLLDFWTYGCINCIHVIPDLQALEDKYEDELVVIGVHSAKFDHEGGTENIRLVSERYDRTHPVVNDNEFELWRSYGIAAWPSFILIDPEGMVLGRHSGEGIFDLFDSVIASMIEVFDARGTLDRTPLLLNAGAVVQPRAALRFPGGILADEAGNRLFIADSANHRIVVTDLTGVVLEVIGTGVPELRDGWLDEASFQRPHGMALAGPDVLYVADTGNHSIRLIDLSQRTVTTVAGVGRQEYMFGLDQVDALVDGLNSPWDVYWQDGILYVAMAGQHQLWKYLPDEGTVRLHAGSGREELRDGPLLVGGMNQPSGIASDGDTLYVADSEASAIRAVDVFESGSLMTVVGTGLFDFGDVDGTGDEVRLQHPKALVFEDGLLYVADTYNNRIKSLEPESETVTTLVGSGESGWADGAAMEASFHEPGAISVANGRLYVADTNNHAVRVISLDSLEVGTLQLSDASGLLLRRSSGITHFDDVIMQPAVEVAAGEGILTLELSLPDGYTANHLAPLSVSWHSEDAALMPDGATASQDIARAEYPVVLEFPYRASEGSALLAVELAVYYCQEEAAALCLIRQARLEVPVSVLHDSAPADIALSYTPPALAATSVVR